MSAAWQGRIRYVRWASLLTIAAAFLLLLRALPVDRLFAALQAWVGHLGFWGPAIFAAVYALAATLFLPASALTLIAGAVFGLGTGVAAAWLGAVLAVVFSFLIGRYFARARVERIAQDNPRFGAVDKALGEEGWKIVALLRLSPVFPFNVQNYLYGVSSIRFWPCVLASAVFMLPERSCMFTWGISAGRRPRRQAAGAWMQPGWRSRSWGSRPPCWSRCISPESPRAPSKSTPLREKSRPPRAARRSRNPPPRETRRYWPLSPCSCSLRPSMPIGIARRCKIGFILRRCATKRMFPAGSKRNSKTKRGRFITAIVGFASTKKMGKLR